MANDSVKVLPPIPTSHLSAQDVQTLAHTTRELMMAELIELTESPLGQKATKASVENGEEDLAELVAQKTSATAKYSTGVRR